MLRRRPIDREFCKEPPRNHKQSPRIASLLGRLAKCELDKVGREISPCMASVPFLIGRPSARSFETRRGVDRAYDRSAAPLWDKRRDRRGGAHAAPTAALRAPSRKSVWGWRAGRCPLVRGPSRELVENRRPTQSRSPQIFPSRKTSPSALQQRGRSLL
jgi:hypothetical protein